MIPGISVVVPTVAPRAAMLRECLRSIADQTLAPDAIIVQKDVDREGAAVTRQKGTDRVDTEWCAFVDDDDLVDPTHLQRLSETMEETGADLVYPWYRVENGSDPLPFFGQPWDNANPHLFPVTFLARTEIIRAAGGWRSPEGSHEGWGGEDWALCLSLIELDAKIVHLPEISWTWRHWGGNSSGRPERVNWGA